MKYTVRIALLLCTVASAASLAQQTARKFFAFDNGLTRIASIEDKATVLKELGFDGIGWRPGRTAEAMTALNTHGLKVFSHYVRATVDADKPGYDPRLPAEIKLLKPHGTVIWLFLVKGKKPTDEAAIKIVQEVADLAAESGLRVALYPHTGFYVATTSDALRIAAKADRSNAGVSFNLCHFLKQNDESELEATIRATAPRLFLVSINGAETGATTKMGWDKLIQPLDRGGFDNARLLKLLDSVGYDGPIGLQCYSIKGDDRGNLRRSMSAWRRLTGQPEPVLGPATEVEAPER